MHFVDLGKSFQTHIYLQILASIQPRTSPVKFARSLENARLLTGGLLGGGGRPGDAAAEKPGRMARNSVAGAAAQAIFTAKETNELINWKMNDTFDFGNFRQIWNFANVGKMSANRNMLFHFLKIVAKSHIFYQKWTYKYQHLLKNVCFCHEKIANVWMIFCWMFEVWVVQQNYINRVGTFGIIFFYSEEPPKPIRQAKTPKQPFPYWKIYKFMRLKPSTYSAPPRIHQKLLEFGPRWVGTLPKVSEGLAEG